MQEQNERLALGAVAAGQRRSAEGLRVDGVEKPAILVDAVVDDLEGAIGVRNMHETPVGNRGETVRDSSEQRGRGAVGERGVLVNVVVERPVDVLRKFPTRVSVLPSALASNCHTW